jgi:hypothetical protein
MLIEFQRAVTTPEDQFGEEGDVPEIAQSFISINPVYVAAVFAASREPGVLIIRMNDGRGFKVLGNYQEALQRLQSHTPAAAAVSV